MCTPSRNNPYKKPGINYVWDKIKENPDMYCWIPTKKENPIVIQNIPSAPISEVEPLKEDDYQKILNQISESAIALKKRKSIERIKIQPKDEYLVSVDDPEKYNIVRDFIIKKGLKLYGGVAINLYLPKEQRIYKEDENPDYDFYSPDPWNDAVELAEIFYKKGYKYVEVKSGIHPGTFKVFVNLWPVADITWLPKEQFDNLDTSYIDGLPLVGIFKLMEAFYKEFSEPFGNALRWPKVASREKLIQKWVKPLNKNFKCSDTLFIKPDFSLVLPEELLRLLDVVYTFFYEKNVLVCGKWAYNKYIEIAGGDKRVFSLTYEGLIENAKDASTELLSCLLKINPHIRIETEYAPYKDIIKMFYNFYVKVNEVIYKICVLGDLEKCIPVKDFDKFLFVSVDYVLYETFSMACFSSTRQEREDGKCMAKYLSELQQKYYAENKIRDTDDGPLQRFVRECVGPYVESNKVAFLKRWYERLQNREKVIKKWDDKYRIRYYPKEEIAKECKDRSRNECRYPCGWNRYQKRCTQIPKGVYIPGEKPDEEEFV